MIKDNLALAAAFDVALLEMGLTTAYMREHFNVELGFGEDPFLTDNMRAAAQRAFKNPAQPLDSVTADGIVRHVCANSIVLLKNKKSLLPLTASYINTVALIGPHILRGMSDQIKKVAPGTVNIISAPGCPMGNTFSDEMLAAALSTAVRSDVIVLCLGTENNSDTKLPAPQLALMEAAGMLGKPVVAAVFGTYPAAMELIHKKADAILLVWENSDYYDAALGHVLFGMVNPSGRLPVTLPRSTDEESTYLFARFDPLYPFGYGLSYTHFAYSELRLSAHTIKAGEAMTLDCVVENTGTLPGHEVAQLYIRQEGVDGDDTPRWRLTGFQRFFLQKGESRAITFELPPLTDPARYVVYVGGHQPDARSVWLTETPILSAFIEVE